MEAFAITRILAPTDLSAASTVALRHARLFADRFGARLAVLYNDPIVYPVDLVGISESFFITPAPQHEAALRREVDAHVKPVLEGREIEIEITAGLPVPAILAAARTREADLIVVGTHSRHGWRRAFLGSVSEGVLHGSECPVLTVPARAGQRPAVTSVVCPVNFSDVAHQSLRFAAGLAEAFDARLLIVHVVGVEEPTGARAHEEQVRSWIDSRLAGRCSYREIVLRGNPPERVLDCVDDARADLLVIGAQHKRFRDATVIGSTTERLIRFASCPVLTVPRMAVRQHAGRTTSHSVTEAPCVRSAV